MATKSTPRVLGVERRRRAPGADGPLVNASDHAARWYGVHCSPPLAPADQGDRGEDGCRPWGPERPGLDGRVGVPDDLPRADAIYDEYLREIEDERRRAVARGGPKR